MDDALILLVGGLPIALGVLLGVQGLKVYGLVSGDTAARAAIIIGFILGVAWLASGLLPAAKPYIDMGYTAFVGSMAAGLFYEYIAAPFLEKFGIDLRSAE